MLCWWLPTEPTDGTDWSEVDGINKVLATIANHKIPSDGFVGCRSITAGTPLEMLVDDVLMSMKSKTGSEDWENGRQLTKSAFRGEFGFDMALPVHLPQRVDSRISAVGV